MDHITGQGLLAIKRHEGTPRRLWVTTSGGLLKLGHWPILAIVKIYRPGGSADAGFNKWIALFLNSFRGMFGQRSLPLSCYLFLRSSITRHC
jgi:hypothetical protein